MAGTENLVVVVPCALPAPARHQRFADRGTAQLCLRTGQCRRELDRINQLVNGRLLRGHRALP